MSAQVPSKSFAAGLGPCLALAAAFGFSAKAIFIKLAYLAHPVDALTLLSLRMAFSLPFFLTMACWAQRQPGTLPLRWIDWRDLLWLGAIGYFLSSYFDFLGLQYISAALERLILFLYPTIVVLLSALWHRQALTWRVLMALVLSYGGIALVFVQDLSSLGDLSQREALWLGSGLVVMAAFCYALYMVGCQQTIKRMGTVRFTGLVMSVSTLMTLGFYGFSQPQAAFDLPLNVYALALGMALFSTVLPTWLLAEAIKRLGAGQAALIGSIGPVLTIALGVWFLGESFTATQAVGAASVVAGVFLVTLRRQR